ncbi:MAG: bifunctional phosphoribosylaminoimidazolecarboxamide formyltransferase/IMP cyclohydrolase [Treponema sp.]|nr:bifunctional phosphoribosylaminoimidazolecarboxamide formyltransferase/IMP cyclohydrolase [Treponema sp.]
MKKRAVISVFKKEGVLELASFLNESGWEILSTGGTAAYLTQNNIPVTDVSTVTGFPECLDGRVKTLHPKIHAGILARRDNAAHMEKLEQLSVAPIDLVCVNLYPFFEKVQANLSFNETVEFIDIGGPTMLRAAAKNYQDVIVLTDPADYDAAISEIKSGSTSIEFRRQLAGKVFNLTSAYDAAISRFMLGEKGENEYPEYYVLSLKKQQSLRYGENGHQSACLYTTADYKGAFGGMKQLQGKELSYNNIRDLDVAWKGVCAFSKFIKNATPVTGVDTEGNPTSATFASSAGSVFTIGLKHNTPCGAALGRNVLLSYKKTYNCDPVSIFGGIIGCSAVIDEEAAQEMVKCFLEVIVAPGFTDGALKVFAAKKNLRLIVAEIPVTDTHSYLSVDGGFLIQGNDDKLFEKWDVVTKAKPTQAQINEMAFGMTIAMFAKSNAILVIKDQAAIGIGCGQTNRIWAAEQALERAQNVVKSGVTSSDENATVLISDAFFPFDDTVRAAAKYGIKAIVQPGGSIRDEDSIKACDELGISMVFTGTRHFKH